MQNLSFSSKMKYYIPLFFLVFSMWVHAQSSWQQKAAYTMNIHLTPENNQYQGKMKVTYFNYSPDTLSTIYFHLYYNAFQPNSLMDLRLRHISDPDGRMVENKGTQKHPQFISKINKLKPSERGYQKIRSISQNQKALSFKIMGTVAEVKLNEALLPNAQTEIEMDWEAQIPKIIRRGGRNNQEGVAFSMTQWYPKLAMYDKNGWHLDEYISREFYAPFANFDVSITLPSTYTVGASGKLVNEKEVFSSSKKKEKTWHYKINSIHDFAWAADPAFGITKQALPKGPLIYYVYKKDLPTTYLKNWKDIQQYMPVFFEFMNNRFGKYPWETYTIIQGGDGGMEYGASTLVTGERSLKSLIGTIFHEGAHSWFQHLFGIDETQQEWFDEGFTSYAEAKALAVINGKDPDAIGTHARAYEDYYAYVRSGLQEPLSLLADYYTYNYAYSVSAYDKGQVFAAQLGYIIGEESLKKTFKIFYERWRLDHPSYKDFVKVAEEVSKINLKWYENLFVNTTRTIDYAVTANHQTISLINKSNFAMPLDILVTYEDDSQELFYIPAHAMRGEKNFEKKYYPNAKFTTLSPWGWPAPLYAFSVEKPLKKVEIDPTHRLADVHQEDNRWSRE